MTRPTPLYLTLAVLVFAVACSPSSSNPPASSSAPASGTTPTPSSQAPAASPAQAEADQKPAASKEAAEPLPPEKSPYDALPPESRAVLEKPFTGDADEMVKRRVIRVGVVFNRTQYFIDKGVQRGISYESLKLFEDEVNKRLKTGLLKVHVAIVPMQRDQLGPALIDGKVDLVGAAITITPERRKLADFSNPTRRNVSEIVVSGAHVPPGATADHPSGRNVFVRRGSVYLESVEKLNQSLVSRGKPPATIRPAPEVLEDDDLLEMVNAGLVDATVVDDFVARFWSQVFTNI